MHQTLNYEESKFHFRELRRLALEIEENSDRIIDADIGLVYNHLDENKIDSAYYLITRIEKFAQQAGKKYNKPFIGLHIGYTLFATGDLDARSNTS